MNTKKCIKLLAKAIERVTVNAYTEQGQAGANEVFKLLEQVESEIKTGECGENSKTTEAPTKTNFDRITASVGSLAKFLYVLADGCGCRCGECPFEEAGDCTKEVCIKEWLQKECEE